MQGLAALGIALAALTLSGATAGAVIVGLLALLATARSVCSVSYKDVLGKTVGKRRRGTATGLAGALWIGAGILFSTMAEQRRPADKSPSAPAQMSLLRDHPQLRRFSVARSLLVGTALAPPYLVMLQPQGALSALGALVLAAAFASLASSFVWGRLSDTSSRWVLIFAGMIAAVALIVSAATKLMGVADPRARPGLAVRPDDRLRRRAARPFHPPC